MMKQRMPHITCATAVKVKKYELQVLNLLLCYIVLFSTVSIVAINH